MRIGLIANLKRPHAKGTVESFLSWCTERKHQVVASAELLNQLTHDSRTVLPGDAHQNTDIIVSMGGDGTLLSAVRSASEVDIPVVGINLGSLGFLTPVPGVDWLSAMEAVESGDYGLTERMMLSTSIQRHTSDPALVMPSGLNDVVIHHGDVSRVISIALYANGSEVAALTADGLILSTPTGSTAYNLAAGGPIVHPDIDAIIATPISPFSLTMRPIIFPPDTRLTCRVITTGRKAVVTIDGQVMETLEEGELVSISRSSHRAKLVSIAPSSFYDILRRKLNWSIPPRG